jgi:plasmid stability protein
MIRVPTLHVRNVPPKVYAALKKRASRHGRSLNAEVIEVLEGFTEQERRGATIADELRRLAEEVNLPPDAPKPEEIIREARDERARRF